MSSENSNQIIGLICAICFIVLTLFIPFTGVLGGFFQQTVSISYSGITINQYNEYMWDGIEETALFLTITVRYDSMESETQAGALWELCQVWGLIYLLLTGIGGGLVAFYALSKISGSEPRSLLGILGVLSGLVGTIGEWAILFITISSEDWTALNTTLDTTLGTMEGTVSIPQINILLLAIFFVGWVLLIYGYKVASRQAIKRFKPETVSYEY